MIKHDTTETIYEYDKEGKLIKKTVTETHEEEENTTLTYPIPYTPNATGSPNDNWWKQPYVTRSNTDPIMVQKISSGTNTTTHTTITD